MRCRELVVGGPVVAFSTTQSWGDLTSPGDFLSATPYIDKHERTIRDTATSLCRNLPDDRARALAIFAFVRDRIPFGFAAGFWRLSASEVLEAGRGYCNTKSTLFVALLRAAGIPARQIFVEIDAAVLKGLLDPGTPYLDHSYVEVFLDGAWRPTDAYIVDQALFFAARSRIRSQGRAFGYGVHRNGTLDWNGHTPSFSQYNLADPSFVPRRFWGVYSDIGAFYAEAEQPWNRLNGLLRASFGVMAAGANARAASLRRPKRARAPSRRQSRNQ